MKTQSVHRYAILLAFVALIVITLGASLTSQIRPLPGAKTPSLVTAPSLEEAHRIAGYVMAVMTLGLALWYSRLPGWIAFGIGMLESITGGIPVLHALLAPAFVAAVAAVAVSTSKDWTEGPRPVESDWGPLRGWVLAVPILAVMQIGLGAAFRHNDMGVVSHILNALIVLTVALVAGCYVLRQYPEHPSLRPAALALLIVIGIQVLLGFAVYMVRQVSDQNNMALIVTGVLHVVNGSLTLAASVALAMQITRNVAVTDRVVTVS